MSSPTAVPSASSSASPSHLLVVYAEHDLVEAALSGEGQGVNKPVVRKRNILDALQAEAKARGEKDLQATQAVRFEALKEPAASLAPAALVHEPGMLDLFATGWARWEALGDKRDLYFTPAGRIQPADWSELIPSASTCRDALQRAPKESIHAQVNYYAQCRTTPITKHTSALLHNDLAVTLRAVEAVKNGEAREVYACTTQPGHHSSYTSYGGYCYINQAALCAALLSEHFRSAQGSSGKVAFIDVDYHAGNGSMSIFYERDDVFFASIHADPLISYPYTSNFADQTGAGAGAGCTMNVCLGKDTTWAEYRPALAKVLAAVQAFGARALVVSLGVDTLAGDPEAAPLGGFAIQQQDYDEMGRMVREVGLPTIWVQEGGYKLDEAGDVVRHILLGPTAKEEAARSKQ